MSTRLKLRILTPERTVLEEDVDAVSAETLDGEFGILPNHIPMACPLTISVFYYVKDGVRHPASVMGGLLSTDGRDVTVLSEVAELSSEIDKVRAQHAKERAEALLRQHVEESDVLVTKMALQRALVRLKASGSGR